MKRLAAIVLTVCSAATAIGETNVAVSIGINQPGVYGRIDIGNFPQPAVIYNQPILIAPQPTVVHPQPVYLYVPPGHQKNWAKYCGRYGACAQPVYFVQERWVRERYEEQQHRGHGNGQGKKEKKHKDRSATVAWAPATCRAWSSEQVFGFRPRPHLKLPDDTSDRCATSCRAMPTTNGTAPWSAQAQRSAPFAT